MQIFVVDQDPVIAAQSLCDKHVVKQVLESAQMLCSVSLILGGTAPYKICHKNHPCTIWSRQSIDNYDWHMQHAFALSNEYTFRYNKIHKCQDVLKWLVNNGEKPKRKGFTSFAQAMPDSYKRNCAVEAYHAYYNGEKQWAVWNKGRTVPDWFKLA